MRFEDVLDEVGGFGRFQFLVLSILCLPRFLLALQFLLHNFISAVPDHRCAPRPSETGPGLHTKSLLQVHGSGSPGLCWVYGPDNSTVSCPHGWVYNQTDFSSTTATEWDLVCEDRKLNQVLATYFFLGVTVGAVVFGQLSDKFGRRSMLLVALVLSTVMSAASAFSTSYVMFAVSRALCGVALSGLSIIGVVLGIEWTDVRHRTFTGTVMSLSWSLGNMCLGLMAFLIRDWRLLTLAVTVPCALAIVCWWWLPESARWLLVNGRTKEARTFLVQCAIMNKRNEQTSKLDLEVLAKVSICEEVQKTHSYLDLVKTPQLRKITLCSGLSWFAVAFLYYGISLKISGLGVSIYLTQFIYGAIEAPAKIASFFVLDWIGRRNGQACFLIITGALVGVNTALPLDLMAARTCVSVIAKGFSEAAFTTAFLYSAELYPTTLRYHNLGSESQKIQRRGSEEQRRGSDGAQEKVRWSRGSAEEDVEGRVRGCRGDGQKEQRMQRRGSEDAEERVRGAEDAEERSRGCRGDEQRMQRRGSEDAEERVRGAEDTEERVQLN
uniref:Major facilitator superfamily (MFS) profile domain-containing protein n=1 Tax=Periophthalmus magnuspinnatus TaxID=409849 RepID=A0A3B4AY89_9GOBI